MQKGCHILYCVLKIGFYPDFTWDLRNGINIAYKYCRTCFYPKLYHYYNEKHNNFIRGVHLLQLIQVQNQADKLLKRNIPAYEKSFLINAK